MIRAVTLDVGGTLIRPWRSVGRVYAEVAAVHGWPLLDPADLERRFRRTWNDRRCRGFRHTRSDWETLVDATFGGLVVPPPSQTFFPALFDRFADPDVWEVYADVLPALNQLRSGGWGVGIVSNWDSRLRPLLERLDLAGCFSVTVISCETPWAKPDPRIFLHVAEQFGLLPSEILHVGDDPVEDYRAAIRAGFQARIIDRRREDVPAGSIASLGELGSVLVEGGA